MITVFKYDVILEDVFAVNMPKGAKILSVQAQNDKPCMWALVDTVQESEQRIFRLAGTGHEVGAELKNNLKFIGTFQLYGGSFVGHLFEVLSVESVLAGFLGVKP